MLPALNEMFGGKDLPIYFVLLPTMTKLLSLATLMPDYASPSLGGGTATSRIDFVLIPVSWWVPSGVPAVPWEVDAHRHYHAASSYLLGELSRHFPVKGCTRRRPFFSDTTWSLRQQRTWLRKRAHRASGTLKLYDVHCAFQAWRTDGSFRYELQRHFSEVFRCIAQLRHSVVELRKLKPAFRKSLRRDKGLYITQVALQAATSNTKDVVQRLRPLLGPPRRKQRGIAPLPVVRLEDGTFASTPQEADARWLRHFSAAEHGGPIEPDDLIQRCLNRQYGADLDAFDVDPHDLPTKCELEQAFRAAQPGRASGNDGMPPDILHLFPGEMAKIFYPVLLKVAFRLQEPIQFKGGSVSHIYKHKGDQVLPGRSYVREDSLLIPAGASPWAASVVREFQEDSWLTVGSYGLTHACDLSQGTSILEAFRKHRRLIFASPIVTHREKVDFAAWLVPGLAAVKKAALVTSYHDGVEIVSNFQGPVRLFAIPEFQEVVELVQPGVTALCASPDTTVILHCQPTLLRIGSIVFADKVHALACARPDPPAETVAFCFAGLWQFLRVSLAGQVWDLVRKQSLFQLSECKDRFERSAESCLALLEELPWQTSEAVEVSPAAAEATESAPSFVLSVQMVSSTSGTGVLVGLPTPLCFDTAWGWVDRPHDQSIMVAGRSVIELQVQQRNRLREIGLPKPATVLAVSPCGGFVAAASENTVMVYRLTAAREEPILSRKVECNVSKLALSSMSFLAVGLGDKVLVCHLSDNKDPRQLVMTGQVHGLAFSPAGDVLAVAAGGDDTRSRASMWIVARDQCHYLGAAVSKQARAVAFSSSGKILAVGCDDGKIPLLLPEQEFKCWTELRLAGDPTCRRHILAKKADTVHLVTKMNCMNLVEEWAGSFLAAAGTAQVSVFNASSGQMVLQIPSYEDTILSISLSTSGSTLACCFRSHVALYPLEECEAEVTHGKHAIQVPSDKEKVKSRGTTANLGEVLDSSGSLTHSIKLTYTGEVSTDDSELRAHAVRKLNSVGSCGKLNKSQTTESGMEEETGEAGPHVHDTGELFLPGLAVMKPRISVTDLSQDGQSGRNTPEEEDAEAAQFRKRALLARDLGLDVQSQHRSPPESWAEYFEIFLIGSLFAWPLAVVCSLSFGSCSTRLVAGGYDQHLVMWDAESMARTAEHHVEAEILCVAISPCGKYVYCGDNDREVNVFDAGTLEVLGKQVLKEQFVSLVGISSPTSLLAVASHIVVKIFSVPDVEEITSLQHGGQVHSLSYSPSLGMLAAAGGIDVTESGLLSYSSSSFREKDPGGMKAVVWKGSSEFAAIWDEVGAVSYKDPCHAASFSPSGKALALGGEDRTISLLSVEKKFRQVEQLPCGAGIRCLAWAANSRLLASAGEDMRVSVWDVLYKRVILQLPKVSILRVWPKHCRPLATRGIAVARGMCILDERTVKRQGQRDPGSRSAEPKSGQGPPLYRPQRYYESPAGIHKVDSILRHLQQTESHDWVGEITHWGTQVLYLLLQNYNITRLSIQSSNFHLIFLTTFFFAQRIWWVFPLADDAVLGEEVHFMDLCDGCVNEDLCHLTLFFVTVDSLYCGLTLAMQDSLAGIYLALPLLLSVLFYHGYLKSQTNVFTAEIFNMLRRCGYHSLEAAYCIGVLPLRFVRYDYIYYDTSRCAFLTFLVTVHIFLSFLCLELHCLGSEALQQTRMLGEWRRMSELAPKHAKPQEWSSHSCPYPR
ncbi:HET-E1, partial [Symbiodinium sp. KB8]